MHLSVKYDGNRYIGIVRLYVCFLWFFVCIEVNKSFSLYAKPKKVPELQRENLGSCGTVS